MSIEKEERREKVQVISTGGCYDCGGRCVLKAHVKNGRIIRVTTDDGEEEPQIRACVRGRALRKLIYDPKRLKYPMKRVGTRGDGRFERISWDQALDNVADKLTECRDQYGLSSILLHSMSGCIGALHSDAAVIRLMHMFGGCTRTWGGPSAEGNTYAVRSVYGTLSTGHTRDDLLNSKLIIMWGWNPVRCIWSTNTAYYLFLAKEAGAKIIVIDPRFTVSAGTLADQWIPIRPGTDTAMLIAMAYVMIKENIYSQGFLDTYTIGFGRFKDYVLGLEDGVAKTPDWAERITGVKACEIKNLAIEYATHKPAALIAGFAPGRTAYGEQYHRAASTLAAMSGNVGIHGGGAAGFERGPVGIMMGKRIPIGTNPLEKEAPSLTGSLDTQTRNRFRVHSASMWDAILNGSRGGYPSDIRMLYVVAANPLNQLANINKGIEALKKLDFIIVHEQFMTATARFADILLPVSTIWERDDICRPWLSGPYYLYLNKVIEPLYESKSDYEICLELAPRLGIENFDEGRTVDEWLKEIVRISPDMSKDIPDYDAFKNKGIQRIQLPGPTFCLKEQFEDPEHNPFPTDSGKIEIFSRRLADFNNPDCPPIPKYIEGWEGSIDPLAKKYPLQLVTQHLKTRAHSCFDNIPWLKEIEEQRVWINIKDAGSRSVKDGDKLRVFNDRGQMIIRAKVTERIMPGIIGIPEGAWYNPDPNGVDRGGCPNILENDVHSPGGAYPFNTCLVEIEKAK